MVVVERSEARRKIGFRGLNQASTSFKDLQHQTAFFSFLIFLNQSFTKKKGKKNTSLATNSHRRTPLYATCTINKPVQVGQVFLLFYGDKVSSVGAVVPR